MLDPGAFTRLSKTVAHALRHAPWLYELELDAGGWVAVDALIAGLRQQNPTWKDLEEQDLLQMIARSTKPRFEVHEHRIRARYGHSLPGKLQRTPAPPPAVLFHGTSRQVLSAIADGGLRPMGRQYVHLSVDRASARAVGRRKTRRPVILEILAADAFAQGVQFYEGNEHVWLADAVPAAFIRFEDRH